MKELLADALNSPLVFVLGEPASHADLDEWLRKQPRTYPPDLVELWRAVGGGDFFETEEFFSPGADADHDINGVNRLLWNEGLDRCLLAFHAGLYVTAVDEGGQIVQLDPRSFRPIGAFASIADWYFDLRREYGEKYGLPPSFDGRQD